MRSSVLRHGVLLSARIAHARLPRAARRSRAAASLSRTCRARRGELDDLYCELGRLVNEAYNAPGTVDEASVCALNDRINAKREELREIKK